MDGIRTFPAGLAGSYYAVGHSRRLYRSCAVSGVYTIPDKFSRENNFIELLKYALAKTITRHPVLCNGIIGKTEKCGAHFLQLQTIHWEDIVEIKTSTAEGHDDTYLSQEIGKGHERLFEDQHRKPAWRIVVLRYTNEPRRVDILNYSHHAVGDGTSFAAFHKTLYQYLQEGSSPSKTAQPAWPYVVPNQITRPVFLEVILPFPPESQMVPVSHSTTEGTTFSPWTAAPPSLDPFRSLALIITIPPINVSNVLNYCRQQKITLTGLLHSLITIYLSCNIPSAQGFRATTPFSMRRFTNTSNDEIVNHVSSVTHDWTETLLSSIRKLEEDSPEEAEIIRKISWQFQREVTVAIDAVPEQGAKGLIELSKIPDLEKQVDEMLKRDRSNTYEISNVGLVKLVVDGDRNLVKLERLIFSQCGMVTGAAIGCSVVSIVGGPLCLCISWQEGILEDHLGERLKKYLERRLLAFP